MKDKIRILIGNDMFHGGGVEYVLQTMSKYFLDKGYDVTILASPLDGQNIYDYYDPRVHFIRNRMRLKEYQGFSIVRLFDYVICKAHNIIKKIQIRFMRYDIVIALKEGITTKDLAHVKAKTKLAWFHCDHRNPNYKKILRDVFSEKQELKCMQCYDKVVCVAEASKDSIIETIGDPGNLCVLYNPIDWKKIRAQAAETPKFIKNPSKPLIVAVGRLHKVKNYPLMLKAAMLAHQKVEFDLWILGEGDQREKIEKYISEKGLSYVKLLGMQDNPYTIIKQADFFLNTSTNESNCIAIQEAYILGVPVVAVKNPGTVECFSEDYTYIVDGSAKDVSEAIIRMIQDSSLRSGYKERIEKEYPLSMLYEDRMELICNLFDSSLKIR